MEKEDLFELLDGLEPIPIDQKGEARGKVDYSLVIQEFEGKWATVADMVKFIQEDCGVESISYSAPHSWLRRLHKKGNYTVTKVEHEGSAYYKIEPVE